MQARKETDTKSTDACNEQVRSDAEATIKPPSEKDRTDLPQVTFSRQEKLPSMLLRAIVKKS